MWTGAVTQGNDLCDMSHNKIAHTPEYGCCCLTLPINKAIRCGHQTFITWACICKTFLLHELIQQLHVHCTAWIKSQSCDSKWTNLE